MKTITIARSLCALVLAAALPASALDLGKLVDQLNENPELVEAVGGVIQNTIDANRTVGPKEEATIGDGLAANLLGAAPLVRNAELQRYVNQVGQWVASRSEQPGINWRFGVIDSPNVNGFATPGGAIFITRGLYQRLRDEAELAGVLAHEISHVLARHHMRAIQAGKGREALGSALQGFISYKQSDARQLGANAISGMSEVFVRGLDKDDEHEADIRGMVLSARAGYNPYALVSVLQTLSQINPADSTVQLMFSTHPSPGERLNKIDQIVGDRLERYSDGVQATSRFYPAR
ncbi:M48 family metalloprotease [Chitiniphilus purpureus]|uniref:M48 family metalloprotease n=1 Tax=Chitiniphilus purpureus TaxID=2981137 RepID=A0ABY6DM55_9NEIS|nr:M48 family metalloprotease [Chitiniphilus sp. CD1]UXY15092.1 M48 family metalloprotease [Chitiniphilus sp. CD1]